jgi:general secretion pathway protein J
MERKAGFTLLEVLLAITVLGVVIAMLSISLSGTLKVVETTQQQEEIYQQAQTALRRITEDLTAAVQLKERAFIGTNNEMEGERADTLVFASLAHLVFNPEKQKSGMAVIGYQLKADADDARKLKLLRSDTPILPGVEYSDEDIQEPAFLLADNLRSVRFKYFDGKGLESENWSDVQSDDPDQVQPLPAAVNCTLEFWLDPVKKISQTFSTGILIPTGAMAEESKDEK